MNFFPKNIFVGRRADGTRFTIEEYDFETYSSIQFFNSIGLLIAFVFIAMVASPILLLFFLLQYSGRFHFGFVICSILSGYFLFDCSKGWFLSSILTIFLDESQMSFFVNLNIACIGICVYYTIVGRITIATILEMTENIFLRYIIYLSFSFLIGFIVFGLSERWLPNNWAHENAGRYSDDTLNNITNDNQNLFQLKNSFQTTSEMDNVDETSVQQYEQEDMVSENESYQIGEKLNGGWIVSIDDSGKHGLIMIETGKCLDFYEAVSFLDENNLRLPSCQELEILAKNRLLFNDLKTEKREIPFWTSDIPATNELKNTYSKEYYTNFNDHSTTENEVDFRKTFNPFTDQIKLIDTRMQCNFVGLKGF